MRQPQLEQLTGCRYAVLVYLRNWLMRTDLRTKRGRPFKHTWWTMLVVTLIKLRQEMAYRSLEIFVGIDAVTLSRYVNRICALLGNVSLITEGTRRYLIVDSTCSRIRSTNQSDYSGYKHHNNRKCQMVVDDQRRVVATSVGYAGSVHDKQIWNREFAGLEHLLEKPILGDKAYAGGAGEGRILFRPIKRNEIVYKADPIGVKAFNKELSRWRVTVEHVFAQLKSFRILRDIFPLQPKRYEQCFRMIALVYNLNLGALQAAIDTTEL